MTNRLITRADCLELCRRVGVRPGMSVMFHCSLRGLGYLVNGPFDLIDALVEAVGPDGTLLMPAHSGQLTDPADWRNPPVPAEWVDVIRREMAPFDPAMTPIRGRGIVPEWFLRRDGARRSHHPLNSTAALGARAEFFTRDHPLHAPEGPGSPCHKLYRAGGHVLLLGVGLATCTALHVAEHLADCPYLKDSAVKVLVRGEGGANRFVRLESYPESSDGFVKLRPELLAADYLVETVFGEDYPVALLSLAPAVDLAVSKLKMNPTYFHDDT
ncbi:MAG TPA: AAC(3) family N-acetyltransferase [Rhodospirillales bacterium]|nr:AAC(3) family N-acetyltransferase [Rhodospirillales bacterium]